MPKITSITSRKILNSRCEWTIEVAVSVGEKLQASFAVPEGKSKGSFEAKYVEPETAIKNIKEIIEPELEGFDSTNQEKIDKKLIELDGTPQKSKLGANAILGVSIACAKVSALSLGIPLFKYLQKISGSTVSKHPRLYINMIEGGVHAGGGLDFQEYLVIPKAESIGEAVSLGKELYQNLREYLRKNIGAGATNIGDEGGFAPGIGDNLEPFSIIREVAKNLGMEGKIDFGMDAAANNVGSNASELSAIYHKIKNEYGLAYIEDPFKEEDFESFGALKKELGDSVVIAGDDLTATNLTRMKKAHDADSINGVVIKPNQIGTISETFEAVSLARKWNWAVIVSHRGGETNDDFIADLACAVGADGIKLGGLSRGERIAKYNRLLEIG